MNRFQLINQFHARLIASGRTLDGYYLSGWSSPQSQSDRFQALLRAAQFEGGSVIDYGCGSGDLFGYLQSSGYAFDYLGLDQNSDMIRIAKAKYGARFDVIGLDEVFFSSADYIFCSGVFQFRDSDNPYYYDALIRSLFRQSKRCIAFNVLSANRLKSEMVDEELYFEPREILGVAQATSQLWLLDHSYHPGLGDMTVALHRAKDEVIWRRPKF